MTARVRPQMSLRTTEIGGCVEIVLRRSVDVRGSFVKIFQASALDDLCVGLDVREVFVSMSAPGVVRGMHVQLPPADGDRLVTCLAGAALDVVLDLRIGSPTFGRPASVRLDDEAANAVFVPAGCAHGFAALEDGCTLAYVVGSEHDPEWDTGVRWDSFGFEWPFDTPLVSERDAALPPFGEFESPFRQGSDLA